MGDFVHFVSLGAHNTSHTLDWLLVRLFAQVVMGWGAWQNRDVNSWHNSV